MRLLLDACVSRKLAGHTVWTAREKGLEPAPGRSLLDVMSGEIDALITMDRGLRFQQPIHGRSFAVILLRAKSNRLDRLLPLVAGAAAGAQ